MKSYSLQYYVDKLNNHEKFSMARYGDGEFNCIWGKGSQNSNGCQYTPALKMALIRSFEGSRPKDPTFIYGMQRVLPQDKEKALRVFPGIDWHDTEVFSESVARGELFPFIEALRRKRTMVIGNFSIRDVTKEILPLRWFFEVPPTNAFEEQKDILEAVRWNSRFNKDFVYLFSCGMAANALISELHGTVDGWLLDVGHIWDPFAGSLSRCDLDGKTLEEIDRNLHG